MTQKKRSSARKPKGKPKPVSHKGTGVLPHDAGGDNPIMIFARLDPIHTAEEWDRIGRPLWLVRFTEVPYSKTVVHVFARTQTPTCQSLAVVLAVPYRAHSIECGVILPAGEAGEQFEPAQWEDAPMQAAAIKRVKRLGSPEAFVRSWDRILKKDNAQTYWDARAGAPVTTPQRGPTGPDVTGSIRANVGDAVARNTAEENWRKGMADAGFDPTKHAERLDGTEGGPCTPASGH